MPFCSSCGSSVPEGKKFCTQCGEAVRPEISSPAPPASPPPQTPVRTTGTRTVAAAVLCLIVLAGIGYYGISAMSRPAGTGSLLPASAGPIPSAAEVYPAQYTSSASPTGNSAPVYVVTSSSPQAAFGSQTGMTSADLAYGVSISYPVVWQKEEADLAIWRDYGRNVINIANFRSPAITSDRAFAAEPNPDKSGYTSLSIDVDPAGTSDFERYFNLATLAVTDRYGKIDITKRNVVLKISVTDTFPGYKSYELDFDAKDIRGKYIFTNVEGTVYIFAFRNPSPYSREVENIYKSILISPDRDT